MYEILKFTAFIRMSFHEFFVSKTFIKNTRLKEYDYYFLLKNQLKIWNRFLERFWKRIFKVTRAIQIGLSTEKILGHVWRFRSTIETWHAIFLTNTFCCVCAEFFVFSPPTHHFNEFFGPFDTKYHGKVQQRWLPWFNEDFHICALQ